ncbi:NADH-quinone oxidoreductase subunit L [Niastella yeongjuensis]|uniref:NADH-ubiquinone oxidoreductase chain 5 n=1 Tax=Niastella yeongjuensis TaxID=354355 RepID=A0A1V9EJB4_9BACT|nr:NADH-quinone oxidoreductase subunit L [Niastella yeongjuensis]OQP46151.1 NADH-quinone oxidoreductase subunit L [Niastella yeongjuensis]SEP18123.1 NADH-quinone oxidoreductase subunit L [Niastella yeongjuensis]
MEYASYIALIPLLPLAGFVVLGLFGQKHFSRTAGIVGTLILLVATVLACYTAYQYFFVTGKVNGVYQTIEPIKLTWLPFSPGMSIDMGILLDPASVMMLVVVTFISLMVHVFSLGYMKGEERFAVYYAFLSLFTFSMLGLVLSTNIFQLYIFWELVGVSSFLLIGFYYDRPAAVAAAKKAFIVTRFADLGFLIGILILAFYSGTLDFGALIQRLTATHSTQLAQITGTTFLGVSLLSWALALVFIGGAGKSAMFPLHIWLPDAMEGPTPVSALIHAATMVVAGVYLVARLYPVYLIDGTILQLITWIGALSALLAGLIACTQTDIKRVLAYSTISQIGYMLFALGLTGYTASLFHLFTHAFFKSLLFLGVGSVIHFVHTNEMGNMGGLRKEMPLTHGTFLIACFAIAGVPPFAGFYSKEEILMTAWEHNKLIYYGALVTSGITAFYMFRLYFRIFWNKTRVPDHHHHSEGTWNMKLPLVLLALAAVGVGFIPFARYVAIDGEKEISIPLSFSLAPVLLALAGIAGAYGLYYKENERPQKLERALGGLYKTVKQKFYFDELYLFVTKKIIFNGIAKPAAWIDKHVVDGTMNGLGWITTRFSISIRTLQSGRIQGYLIYFLGGIVALAAMCIYLWK